LPMPVEIDYESIKEIRMRRIKLMVSTIYEILEQWEEAGSFKGAVRKAFTHDNFKSFLMEDLHLYSLETRELSNSFMPPLAKELFAGIVFNTMAAVPAGIAGEISQKIFGD
jgi:hypothetical protein